MRLWMDADHRLINIFDDFFQSALDFQGGHAEHGFAMNTCVFRYDNREFCQNTSGDIFGVHFLYINYGTFYMYSFGNRDKLSDCHLYVHPLICTKITKLEISKASKNL